MAIRQKPPDSHIQANSKRVDVSKHLKASAQSLPNGPVTFEQIVSLLGPRSFGFGLLMFSVPMILPMPPGVPMAAGFVISIFGIQLLFGRMYLWLPKWIMKKTIERNTLITAYKIVEKYLGWMFRMARPRLPQLTALTAKRLSGLIFAILGLLMILPIPIIGNIFPAFACTVLALGLTDRDGVIFSIGVAISGLAIFATIMMGFGAVDFLKKTF